MSNETPGSAVNSLAAVNQRLLDLVAALALACEASGDGWATAYEIGLRATPSPRLDQIDLDRIRRDLEYLEQSQVVERFEGVTITGWRPRPRGGR